MKTIDLFCGIGGIRLGFEAHGAECVFSSDWDKDSQLMYEANFGHKPEGDITKINPKDIPDHDILLGGFPCQPFSILGKSLGFADTRGTLFFNIEEILRVKKPYAFMLENVKQLKSHDGGRTLSIIQDKLRQLGYHIHVTVLNALDFGVPQKRERIIFVGFKDNIQFQFPKPLGSYKPLSEVLEPDSKIDKSLFASDAIRKDRLEKVKKPIFKPSVWHQNKGGNISMLPYSCALRAGASYSYLLVNGERRLSSREMLRLQGFPDSFKINVNYGAMRKLTGNSVAVPVMTAVAGEMMKAIKNKNLVTDALNEQPKAHVRRTA
jgi:DNA (cytosine-5)-methyltransferase 1